MDKMEKKLEELEEIKRALGKHGDQPLVWHEEGIGFFYLNRYTGDEMFIGRDIQDFWENFGC